MKLRDLVGSHVTVSDVSEDAELASARRRVRKVSTHDLLEWADAAGSGMAKGFGDYRKDRELVSLEEIRTALMSLLAVTDELYARQDGENS